METSIVAGATKNIVTEPGTGAPNTLLYNNVAAITSPLNPNCKRKGWTCY
jgi:hypothetical protein